MLLARCSRSLGRFATRRPWLALVGSFTACLALAIPALGMRLDTDFLRLLPEHAPAVRDFVEIARAFGSTDTLVGVVEATDLPADAPLDPDRRARARVVIDRMAEAVAQATWTRPDGRVEPLVEVERIEGRPQPGLQAAIEDQLVANTWLMLDDDALTQVLRRLKPDYLPKALAAGPGPATPPRLIARDPLGLWTRTYLPFWSRLTAGEPGDAAGDGIDRSDGYFAARRAPLLALVLHATHAAQDRAFAFAITERLDAIAAAVAATPAASGFAVRFAGGHFIAAADYRVARDNSWQNLSTGVLGVLALFLIVYRSPKLILLIASSLLPAVFAAAGVSRLFLGGELSLVATAFAAIVVGVGVDFVIHLYSGYGWAMRQRTEGRSSVRTSRARRRAMRSAAAVHALVTLMPSIAAGCLTTVVAFAVLALSDFRGLVELGVLSGVGLSVILVQLMIALPAFLTLFGPPAVRNTAALAGFGRLLARRPWPFAAVVGGALVVAVAVLAVTRPLIAFDPDPRSLRPLHDPLFDAQLRLAERLGLGSDRFKVLIRARDGEAALGCAARVMARARALGRGAELTAGAPLDAAALAGGPVDLPVDGLDPELVALGGPRFLASPLGRLRAAGLAADRLVGVTLAPDAKLPPSAAILAAGAVLSLRPAARAAAVPMLADPARQRATLARIADEVDWTAIERLADDARWRERYAPFWRDLAAMRERVVEHRPLIPDELARGALAPLVAGVWRRGDDGIGRLALGFAAPDLGPGGLRGDELARLFDLDRCAVGDATAVATGMPVLSDALQASMVHDFVRLGLLALVLVVALLVWLMHSLLDAAVALLVLAAGVALMLAAMHLTGQRWNLVNLGVMPLVIGIGIDNGIYFINALRRHRRTPDGVAEAMAEVGYPMLMTTATSVIGFASCFVTPYRGLQSLGAVSCIGLIACLLVAMVGLPAVARLTTHRRAA